jgi:hypothetical protein
MGALIAFEGIIFTGFIPFKDESYPIWEDRR